MVLAGDGSGRGGGAVGGWLESNGNKKSCKANRLEIKTLHARGKCQKKNIQINFFKNSCKLGGVGKKCKQKSPITFLMVSPLQSRRRAHINDC